ncbi:MAG: TolC family protein [Bryobacteraceae bacterium]|jgi:outer membrane protein TolC
MFRIFFVLASFAWTSTLFAQGSEVSIESPPPPRFIGPILRPFHIDRRVVAPATLTNSSRLESLVRGGNLYLSVQDVIALVLENNLDIAIQRYGPFLAGEVQRRAEGGGILRSVDSPVLPGPVSVSLTGVSTASSGLAGGAGVGSIGTVVTQAGPTPPNLDPNITAYANFGHYTSPQTNTLLNETTALTNDFRQYQVQYSQQFITGSNVAVTYFTNRSSYNSPVNILNPSRTGYLDLTITQPLLQGLSRAVNNRDIRVARNNTKVTDLQVKRQVITTISAALNLYWDLVSFIDDVRIKEQALATAQKLHEDNQNEVRLGNMPAIEITRAAAEVSARQEDLLISQTNVAQQETVLKNALSREGAATAGLDDIHIVPLDRIEVPKTDDLRPTADLIRDALSQRPEIAQSKVNLDSQQIMLKGTRNSLLPSLGAFAEFTNNGLSGPVNPTYNGCCGPTDPYFVGGTGTFLSQLFQRNFPNYSAGISLNIPLRNRIAQADYVMDQLQTRQTELQLQRATNQVRTDVKVAVIGLQQARARYETAVATRQLAEQSLEAEQNKFRFGVSDVSLVIQAQKDLSTDQSAEIQAMANYTHAKVAFDQAIGQTLEVNHIRMEEAVSGHVARASVLPSSVPQN